MKKLISKLMAVAFVLTLVACGSTEDKKEETKKEKEAITIKHELGETVIDKEIKKAVVFDFGTLDNMDALGVDVKVGIPTKSLPEYLNKYAKAEDMGGIKEPNMEAIHAFEPDVIFISGRQADYYNELSDIAPTVYVNVRADHYMDDVYANMENLGKIFDKEDVAKKKVDELKTTVSDAQKKTKEAKEKALIILTNDGDISAYGIGSRFGIVHDVLNIPTADEAIEESTHGQSVNFEYIKEKNPDILYVVDRTQVVGGETDANKALDNDLVKETNAAKNDKIVYLTPDYWYLSGGGFTSVTEMINEAIAPLK